LDKVHYTSTPIMFHQQAASLSEAEFLDEIQTIVLRVLLRAIHSHFYSFVLRFLFLQNSRNLLRISIVELLYTVKKKEGKPDRKWYPLPNVSPFQLKAYNALIQICEELSKKTCKKTTFRTVLTEVLIFIGTDQKNIK
jgi:hypothetical protein